MRVTLTPVAEAEFTNALNWYDDLAPAIAERFLAEFKVLIGRLERNPHQFPIVYLRVHRANFRNFPYGLYFRLKDDTVEIFACFHSSRDPTGWRRNA